MAIAMKGKRVYVIDYWGTSNGTQAFEAEAEIVDVDEKRDTFSAVLYGDTYQTYSFKDFDRLVFDTKERAAAAASSLPKPQTTMYQVIGGGNICKRIVNGIKGEYTDGVYDLVVCFDGEDTVSIKEIGRSLFFSEAEAISK